MSDLLSRGWDFFGDEYREETAGEHAARIEPAFDALIARGDPKPEEVAELIAAYEDIPENSNGGSLHIVIEDGNWEADHVRWCIDYAKERGDVLGAKLGALLLLLSEADRQEIC